MTTAAGDRPAINVTGRLTIETPKGTLALHADGHTVTLAAPSLRAARHVQRTLDRAGGLHAFAQRVGAPIIAAGDVSVVVTVRGHAVGRIDPQEPTKRRLDAAGIARAALRIPSHRNGAPNQ